MKKQTINISEGLITSSVGLLFSFLVFLLTPELHMKYIATFFGGWFSLGVCISLYILIKFKPKIQ